MSITAISEINGLFYVTVETDKGKRYIASYTNKPTEDEVKEDFANNKSSFQHIN